MPTGLFGESFGSITLRFDDKRNTNEITILLPNHARMYVFNVQRPLFYQCPVERLKSSIISQWQAFTTLKIDGKA